MVTTNLSVIPLMAGRRAFPSLIGMTAAPAIHKVEVTFIGAPPPVQQIARASGVSAVEVEGATLRCLVCGSFQPFLEALRGHEVFSLTSIAIEGEVTDARI
jgi:hypothetical protein